MLTNPCASALLANMTSTRCFFQTIKAADEKMANSSLYDSETAPLRRGHCHAYICMVGVAQIAESVLRAGHFVFSSLLEGDSLVSAQGSLDMTLILRTGPKFSKPRALKYDARVLIRTVPKSHHPSPSKPLNLLVVIKIPRLWKTLSPSRKIQGSACLTGGHAPLWRMLSFRLQGRQDDVTPCY